MTTDHLLTIAEAAEMLAVSRGTLYNWVYEQRIDYVKFGGGRNAGVRFRNSVIQKFIAQHEQVARHAR